MKKWFLLLMVLALVVLSGCTDQGSTAGNNWQTFIGGTEGVQLRFETELPPSEIPTGTDFNALVILENRGEYTVPQTDYSVRLKGFSTDEFGVTNRDDLVITGVEQGADLEANVLDPDSGETLNSYEVFMDFPQSGNFNYEGGIAGNTPFPFVAEICYTYQTTAHAKLCIKDDLRRTTDEDTCRIQGPQDVTSSGGPVQISDFSESGAGADAVRFTFKVTQANTRGDVFEPGRECGSDYSIADKVFIEVDTGMVGLECSGFTGEGADDDSGFIKLSGGSRQVSCTQRVDDKGDYIKTVTIKARYDYSDQVTTEVLVKPQLQ